MTHTKFLLSLSAALFLVSGCSSVKETLGLNRKSPDEFAVVKRAPLTLPPDYSLRPPRPGAPRPQEQAPDEQAQQSVFGGTQQASDRAPSSAEQLLLQNAGAENTDPAIRNVVDQERVQTDDGDEKPVAEKILGLSGLGNSKPESRVVDAQKEAERLRKTIEQGKPVTDGETPSVED